MEIVFYLYLFIFGTLFGSFASVIINRVRNHKSGIISGRSECPKCKHTLGPIDLIPLFSFISTKGRCRYCHTKISYLYPLLELSSGVLFGLIGYFLVDFPSLLMGNGSEIYTLIFFLLFGFFTVVYVFYDILYLEIPDSILGILIGISFLTVSLQSVFSGFDIIKTLPSYNAHISDFTVYGLIGLGLLFIGAYYFIMFKGLKEIYDIAILTVMGCILGLVKFYFEIPLEQTAIGSTILGSYFVFLFLFLQIFVSGGAWMGGGDLRIAILMGLIGGTSFSFGAIMISYISGSIFGTVLILYTKIKNYYKSKRGIGNKIRKILGFQPKKIPVDTKMPFGPFLAIGMLGILFYTHSISELITKYF